MAKAEYKYPPDAVERARKYIASCSMEQMRLPTIEELALILGVNDDTLNEWAKIHDDFAEELNRLKLSQKVQLMNGGAFGGKEVNANMFIFLLKANHGMIETNRQEFTGPGGEALRFNFMLYGNNDPIQLRPEELERAGVRRLAAPGTIQSPQLAQESQEDNSGSQSTDPLR